MRDLLHAVPRPRPGLDLRSVDLTAEQAFVYSRLDGQSTVADVCAITGLGEAATIGALRQLKALGLIVVDGLDPEPAAPRGTPAAGTSRGSTIPPPSERSPERRSTPPPPPPAAPSGADGASSPITPERRQRILDTHESLTVTHFYDLLGVPPKSGKPEIRSAYFRLSKEFHPDVYYGKNIGAFREKLEAIFSRLTEAYTILTNKAKRAEYDAYIADHLAAAEMEERLREADRDADRIAREIEQAKVEAALPKREIAQAIALRREALRQRLAGGRKLPSREVQEAQEPAQAATRDPMALADALRRLLGTQKVEEERRERARQCAEVARRAMKEEDFVTAVNAWNLACTLDSSNSAYQAEKTEATARARSALSVTYARQGRYEESLGHLPEACRNYLKAVQGAPTNPVYLERAAALLVATRGDLHQAQEFARRAVELKPDNAGYRVTLASVYEAAQLPRNARRELDVALKMDPKHEEALDLLKRIRRLL